MSATSKGLTSGLDAKSMWTARDPKNVDCPVIMSQGIYGWKGGVDRILALLARYDIKASFFVPSLVIEQRPAVIERILEHGHEITHHSWSHAWIVGLTPEQEREVMKKGFDIIKRVTGRGPAGYRSPAAIDLSCAFADMPPDGWSRVPDVSLTGPMNICDAALPFLKASPAAAIVNIASGAGLSPLPNRTAYCASKAGLVMATKALAMELTKDNIRANVVCSGAADIGLFRGTLGSELTIENVQARYAMGRVGEVSEIAQAVLFLASKDSSYVTGSALAVDGGRTFH